MQGLTQFSSAAVVPVAAKQRASARARSVAVTATAAKRPSGETARKVGAFGAAALAAVMPMAACCVNANKGSAAEIASFYPVSTPTEVSFTPEDQSKMQLKMVDEPVLEKAKRLAEGTMDKAGEAFEGAKLPGLPSGGEILRNAPNVPASKLPQMPSAAEALPKAGRNW